MTRGMSLPALALAGAAVAAGCGGVAAAQERRFSADVNGGVSYATNPYLLTGPQTAAPSAFVEIAPRFVIATPTQTQRVSANLRVEPYFRRYSTDLVAGLDYDIVSQQSERLKIRAGANFQTSRASAQDALTFGTGLGLGLGQGLDPGTTLPPQVGDPTFLGRIQRVKSATVRGGLSYVLGPRDMIDGDVQTQVFRTSGGFGDYNYVTERVFYGRQLSPKSTIRVGATFGQSDYIDTASGDGFSASPVVSFDTQLTSTLKATIGGGVSFARFNRPDGSRDTITALAVQAQLCDRRDRTSACLDVDRSVQPTALGTMRTLTSMTATYNTRLNAKQTLTASAAYQLSGEGEQSTLPGSLPPALFADTSLIAGRVELSHRISERLDLFGSAAYSDIFQDGFARRANAQGRVGIRFRAGSLQ